MKKSIALLLSVLIATSTVSVGFSVVSADESHTTEIMTDVTESTEAPSNPEETSEETEPTEETSEEATDETTEEPTEEEPTEETPQLPKGPEKAEAIVGDYNGDGRIKIDDVTNIQLTIAQIYASDRLVWGDMNGDGILKINDATILQHYIAIGNNLNVIEEKTGVYDPDIGKAENVVSESRTQDEIILTWDSVDGATGYEIFAYNYIDGYSKIGESQDNSFTLSTDPATGYNISVRPFREEEEKTYIGDYSDGINVLSEPNYPILKEAYRIADGSFVIEGQADKLGVVAEVAEGHPLVTDFINGKAVIPPEYADAHVILGNKYTYGDKTAYTYGEDVMLIMNMPSFVADISVDGTAVTITWNEVEGSSGYEVFKLSPDGEYISIADITALSFTDNADCGSENHYSVKYYVLKDGEKQYYSENLLDAVVAPKAESNLSLWLGDTATPKVDSLLEYTLESTDSNVVAVEGKEIKAVSKGTAKVKVLGEWDEEIVINVTVKQAPTTLTLSTYNMIILETEGLTIKATVDDGAESKITFTSSDPSKATVDQNGFVVAYKAGTVTVTAETENGIKAECKVQIYPVDLRTFEVEGVVMADSSWASKVVTKLPKGSQAFVLESKGVWNKIRYGGDTGWVYNRSFDTDIKNYTEISVNSLPTVVDDEIFNLGGPDLLKIFNFVRAMPYRYAANLGSDEANCVYSLQFRSGVCWHHSALFNYMAERIGYEVMYIEGVHYSAHRWTLIHLDDGWYHYDATPLYHGSVFVYIYHATDDVTAQWMTWDRTKYPATPKE